MEAVEEKTGGAMSSLTERVMAGAALLAISGGCAFVWYFDPTKTSIFPVCPLYSMTGLACPGCGLTRGFHALFHGDILTALDFNALIPLFALFFGFLYVSMFVFIIRGRGLATSMFSAKLGYGFFILAIVFGVARNIPFYPFNILYP